MSSVLAMFENHPILIAVVVLVSLVAMRMARKLVADARFGIRVVGGRAGRILAKSGSELWGADYEVGSTVDLIIFRSSFRRGNEPMSGSTQRELIELLKSWARARGTRIEIAEDA